MSDIVFRPLRRACGCLVGLVTLLALLIGAVIAYPYVAPQVPRAASAVSHGVSELRSLIEKAQAVPNTPAPLPSSQPWAQPNSDNCQWGVSLLAQDRTLDLQAAQEYPAWQVWYTTTAGWWAGAEVDLKGLCGQAAEPSRASCQADLSHFSQAEQSHQAAANGTAPSADPGTTAQDRSWNLQWASDYQRLFAIVSQTGCAGVGG